MSIIIDDPPEVSKYIYSLYSDFVIQIVGPELTIYSTSHLGLKHNLNCSNAVAYNLVLLLFIYM